MEDPELFDLGRPVQHGGVRGSEKGAVWAALLGGLLACAEGGAPWELDATMPPQVDRVALLLTDPTGGLVASTPLLPFQEAEAFEAELAPLSGRRLWLVGYESQLFSSEDLTRAEATPLRFAEPDEARLRRPAAAYLAEGFGPAQLQEDFQFELTADWVAEGCREELSEQARQHLYFNSTCQQRSCQIPPERSTRCADVVQMPCSISPMRYARGPRGRVTHVELGGPFENSPCRPATVPNGADLERWVCGSGDMPLSFGCILDFFNSPSEPPAQVESLALVPDPPPVLNRLLRPPYGGYLEGPVARDDGTAWVVDYGERFTPPRCGPNARGRLIRLSVRAGEGWTIVTSTSAPACLRFLHPTGDGGFVGGYVDENRHHHWGRFSPQGARLRSLRLPAGYELRAATRANDRWVLGMVDPSGDGSPNRFATAALDVERWIIEPRSVPERISREPLWWLGWAPPNQVRVGLNGGLVTLDLQTLMPLGFRTSIAPGLGLPEHAHGGFYPNYAELSSRVPLPFDFDFSGYVYNISNNVYGANRQTDDPGPIYVMADSLPLFPMYFQHRSADVTSHSPWPTDPSKMALGLVAHDREAGTEVPEDWRGLVARFDVLRPGYDPDFIDVGPGPVTGLSTSEEDGSLWGILGWTGVVFRIRSP